MTPTELADLKRFCGRFEIDPHQIRSDLNYSENMVLLRRLRLKAIDNLAEEWAKIVTPQKIDYWNGLAEIFKEAYSGALDNIKEVLSEQAAGVLMDWYLIGKEIQIAQQRMRLGGMDVGTKGWSGAAGKLMTDLSNDLDRQRNELYDAVRFVEKFPKWEAFEEQEFDVPRKKGGVLESFKISGSGLSWNQVRKYLLRGLNVKSTVRPNLCWDCGKQFFSESAPVCEQCKTFVCPDGHCFCKIPQAIQTAIDNEVKSRGPQPPRWNRSNRSWLLNKLHPPSEEPPHLDIKAIIENYLRLYGADHRTKEQILEHFIVRKKLPQSDVERELAKLIDDGVVNFEKDNGTLSLT